MKKKPGLFSSNAARENPLEEAPWTLINNLLFSLPPGDKIPVPATRSAYVEIREQLALKSNDFAKDAINFIDFLMKHEKLGNVEFLPEAN